MKGYVIARVNVTDAEQYKKYTAKTPGSIASHGGRFVVRGGDTTTVEGDNETNRVVVIEFDSLEKAKAWYHSDEYTEIRKLREHASTGQVIIIEGAPT